MASKKSQNTASPVSVRRKNVFEEEDVLAARKCLHEMAARPTLSLREIRQAIEGDIANALHRGVQVDQISVGLRALDVRVSTSFVRGLGRKKKPQSNTLRPAGMKAPYQGTVEAPLLSIEAAAPERRQLSSGSSR